jgi:DNA polymerase-3 subunit alpha
MIKFTDLHIHSTFSLQDGAIKIQDAKDPKHIKTRLIEVAEMRNTGAVAITDHGNCMGQAQLASVANTFGLKPIHGCEFYFAPRSRFDKSERIRSDAYTHINCWAKNKEGYANMCRLQDKSYSEGFYYVPRIDKELIEKHHTGLIFSDACVGGFIADKILKGDILGAISDFGWFKDLLKDDFVVEYHNHSIDAEKTVNNIKLEWANASGIPIIACTDAHYENSTDSFSHKALLAIQYGTWTDNPLFEGFPGIGYHLMNEEELISTFPIEYINNTEYVVNKIDENIIEFGTIKAPIFEVPGWFKEYIDGNH